jgi:hypothetical protein
MLPLEKSRLRWLIDDPRVPFTPKQYRNKLALSIRKDAAVDNRRSAQCRPTFARF